ncbi:MAG: PAS domain S-box protein, partial [Planctomycetes bacterium]|nr:PAS domain S-box protein [Planctomycetota bacterium]
MSMKMLVERVADYAIILLDADGRITTWNPAAERMKGYRADEIIGQHFSMLYPDDDAKAKLPERNLKVAADEGVYRGEGRRRRKNGDLFAADVEITPLVEEGRITGYAKIVRDVSERARDRERLRLASEDLEDFASIAAHDLQEPLRMVANYLALHLRRSGSVVDEQSRGYIAQAIDGTKRMQRLIAYLLALARVGREDAPMKPVAMASAWQEAIDTLGVNIREVDAAITTDSLQTVLGHRAYLV